MRNSILIAAVAIIALLPARPAADVSLSLIEYRVLTQLSQVRLTTGFVHDSETQRAMLASLPSFDRQGIILVAGDSARTFSRRETIGAHTVETTISVYPATGQGYGGGMATAGIEVTVDGKKRIDCPYVAGPIELADLGISPLDGMISISGSYDEKHVKGVIFLNTGETIDLAWLQRNSR